MDTSTALEASPSSSPSSSSSSSTTSSSSPYDVFLSFGEDTRKTFTDHLYWTMKDAGIDFFMEENDSIRRGENISDKVKQIIEGSKISVIVFSSRYADSIWCLEELVQIIECRRTLKQMVLPIFYDLSPSDVIATFVLAFQKHRERFHEDTDIQEKLLRWTDALTAAAGLTDWTDALTAAPGLAARVFRTTNGYEGTFIREIIAGITVGISSSELQRLDSPKLQDSQWYEGTFLREIIAGITVGTSSSELQRLDSPKLQDIDSTEHTDIASSVSSANSPFSLAPLKKTHHEPDRSDRTSRKLLEICKVRVPADRPEDGYSWRKYGQKDVLGSSHPRSYYRCIYRGTQGCTATKQVDRDPDDPAMLTVSYRGGHVCRATTPGFVEERDKVQISGLEQLHRGLLQKKQKAFIQAPQPFHQLHRRDAVGRCMDVGFTFTEVNSIKASASKVTSCHFSSDGKLLASGGHDKKALLWYTDTLKLKSTLEEHSALITDVRFSPSMPYLATSSFDKTIRIWDADNPGYSLRNFMGHSASVMSIDFHPNKDDLICSCDGDGQIRYWSINNGSCSRMFKGGMAQIRFQPRLGRFLAAAAENVVSILDVETQTCRHSLQGHTKPIHSVCWDPSGEFLASVSEDSVRVWTLGAGGEGECLHELICNRNKFHSCVFHPTYTSLLVIGCYQTLELWNMTENKTMTLHAHEGLIDSLAVSTVTGLIASASHDKFVKIWK